MNIPFFPVKYPASESPISHKQAAKGWFTQGLQPRAGIGRSPYSSNVNLTCGWARPAADLHYKYRELPMPARGCQSGVNQPLYLQARPTLITSWNKIEQAQFNTKQRFHE